MTILESDLALVHAEYNPVDVFSRVGGKNSRNLLASDVDAVFQPGVILGSDASDSYTYQYRKLHLLNRTATKTFGSVKIYGFNVKRNNIVKFALEKNIEDDVVIDGSDMIGNYRQTPGIVNDYSFTEVDSDAALDIGNGGILPPLSAQGIWLRMMIPKNYSDCDTGSEQFSIGYMGSDIT